MCFSTDHSGYERKNLTEHASTDGDRIETVSLFLRDAFLLSLPFGFSGGFGGRLLCGDAFGVDAGGFFFSLLSFFFSFLLSSSSASLFSLLFSLNSLGFGFGFSLSLGFGFGGFLFSLFFRQSRFFFSLLELGVSFSLSLGFRGSRGSVGGFRGSLFGGDAFCLGGLSRSFFRSFCGLFFLGFSGEIRLLCRGFSGFVFLLFLLGRFERGDVAPLLFGAFKTYKGTFTAKEAVDWMVKNGKATDEAVATEIGAEMVRERLIADVDATHPFVVVEDESKAPLFRFQSEAPALGCAPLNAAKLFTGEPRDAKTVVEDVRRRILKLYDAFLSSDGRAVDYAGIAASDDFKDFVQASEELQRVNLNALTREERMAFFINVYNALVIHGTCVFGTPKNTLERLDFFSKVSYNIDGHNYTCDDIENGVLRGNRPGAASVGALLGKISLSRGPFREKDPRRSNVVLPMDPRVHFALVCGARSCPPIRVYTAENIDNELEDAAYSFFESEIDVTVGENGVASSAAVSKIVGEWYKFDFGADEAERLRYASEYMREGAERDALRKALDDANATVSLTTRAYDWTLNDGK